MNIKMKKNKIMLLVFSLSFLVSCKNGGENDMPKTVNVEEEAKEESSSDVDIASISDYLFEKLDSQKLVRNYGEDTGWTNLEFSSDGNFTGSYFGKIKNDGYDGGLTDYAWNWHRGEEIHTSDFKGKFKIIERSMTMSTR